MNDAFICLPSGWGWLGVRAERRLEPLPLVAGAAAAVLAPGVRFLQPEEAVLDAMLAGWAASSARAC
jgi:hypothetical protein